MHRLKVDLCLVRRVRARRRGRDETEAELDRALRGRAWAARDQRDSEWLCGCIGVRVDWGARAAYDRDDGRQRAAE
jgi:hypothetical protein